jgi:hypothetical protein
MSRAKTLYLKDLAARAVSGALPVDDLHQLDDEQLLEALTAVKGIGRWTAQMFLLFRLGRPNVLPDLDLGVRKGVQLVYGLKRRPTPEEVRARGAVWSPFASVAAWYLWRSLELPGVKVPARRRAEPRTRGKSRTVRTGRPKRGAAKRTTVKRPGRAAAKRTAATRIGSGRVTSKRHAAAKRGSRASIRPGKSARDRATRRSRRSRPPS